MLRYIAEMLSEITNHVMGKAFGQLIRCCRLRRIHRSMVPMCSGMREIAAFWAVRMFYIGYNDNSMSVVSQFELVMTIISGAFLLFHTVSARLLSKKNPYGGKLFWFFKF